MSDWMHVGGWSSMGSGRRFPKVVREPEISDDSKDKCVDMYSIEMCRWEIPQFKQRMQDYRCIESTTFCYFSEDW